MSSHTPSEIRMELFVRSQAAIDAHSRQQEVIDRLDRLAEAGRIDEYDVIVWGREICPVAPSDDTTCHRVTVERLKQFGAWARERGATLDAVFRYRTIERPYTDEEFFIVVTPFVCLAVYEADELVGVYPCTVDGREWTVSEYVDQFDRSVTLPTSPSGR